MVVLCPVTQQRTVGFGVRGILGLYTSTGLAHRETISSLLTEDRSVIAMFQGSVKAAALLAESPC